MFIFYDQKTNQKKCPALWNATLWPSDWSEDSTGPAENVVDDAPIDWNNFDGPLTTEINFVVKYRYKIILFVTGFRTPFVMPEGIKP
jgi:hypothetical protein